MPFLSLDDTKLEVAGSNPAAALRDEPRSSIGQSSSYSYGTQIRSRAHEVPMKMTANHDYLPPVFQLSVSSFKFKFQAHMPFLSFGL